MNILILFYSKHGKTEQLAKLIARGVNKIPQVEAMLRTAPPVTTNLHEKTNPIPEQGAPYVTTHDLKNCSGLILGSPTRFGNMAAPLKYFLDSTTPQWISGELTNKPAGVFCSTSSFHGGQESTLLSMMLPLLHHGMYIVGLPYTEKALTQTRSGGTPYGPTHISGNENQYSISIEEKTLCLAFGKRIAQLAALCNKNSQSN